MGNHHFIYNKKSLLLFVTTFTSLYIYLSNVFFIWNWLLKNRSLFFNFYCSYISQRSWKTPLEMPCNALDEFVFILWMALNRREPGLENMEADGEQQWAMGSRLIVMLHESWIVLPWLCFSNFCLTIAKWLAITYKLSSRKCCIVAHVNAIGVIAMNANTLHANSNIGN